MRKKQLRVSRILKLASLLFVSCVTYTRAEIVNFQNVRITLDKSDVRCEKILDEIERQTNLLFIYGKDVNVSHKVSVKVKDSG